VAVDSVLEQTYRYFEIIVCDDGSTDDSREILARYASAEPRVKVICRENGGQCAAMNDSYKQSRGEIISLLDSDDIFVPQKLERVVQKFRSGLNVSNFVEVIDSAGKSVRTITFGEEGYLGPTIYRLRKKESHTALLGLVLLSLGAARDCSAARNEFVFPRMLRLSGLP
jgi:glycosyltransferase involved in cell wall biosynthesis